MIGALCFLFVLGIDWFINTYQLYDSGVFYFEYQRTFYEILGVLAILAFSIFCIVLSFKKIEKFRRWRIAILMDIILHFAFAVYFLLFTFQLTLFGDLLFFLGLSLTAGFLLAGIFSTLGYLQAEKGIEALEDDKNQVSPVSVHKGIKRPAMFTGVLIATIAFGILFFFDFSMTVADSRGSLSYFWVLFLAALGAATLFSAIGIALSFSSHARYRVNKIFILLSFIVDCLMAFALFLTYISTLGAEDPVPGLPFFMAIFATAAVFTMIGYVNAEKENEVIVEAPAPQPLPPSPKSTKRTFMLTGEIIATATFGLASCYYLYASWILLRFLTTAMLVIVLVSVTATVFSAMGIKIALSDTAHYQKRRGFVLTSFILCCVGGAFILFIFLAYSVATATVESFLVLLCFATAASFIMIDYVKASKEQYVIASMPVTASHESLSDIVSGIAKLDELRKSGVISQEEFDTIKAKHLEKIK